MNNIRPIADDPDSGYSADCAACLRGRTHSRDEHAACLRRAYGVYEQDGRSEPWE
jgi:hypothetical protein